jgi:hypothetical protein
MNNLYQVCIFFELYPNLIVQSYATKTDKQAVGHRLTFF